MAFAGASSLFCLSSLMGWTLLSMPRLFGIAFEVQDQTPTEWALRQSYHSGGECIGGS